jgi:gamma-glutamyltranspeptidase/glutathione hydrolase/leukotriene-C4 hydrolase
MFAERSSLEGGLATGIPGEVAGYWEAWKLGGRLPWSELFQPVINMCRMGFRVSNSLAKSIAKNEAKIRENPILTELFINQQLGKPFAFNDLIHMPQLANTLERIAKENVKAFYDSSLTKYMVEEINQNGGDVTLDDFKSYKPVISEAFHADLDEHFKIFTNGIPSGGLLTAFIMKMMPSTYINFNSNHLRLNIFFII